MVAYGHLCAVMDLPVEETQRRVQQHLSGADAVVVSVDEVADQDFYCGVIVEK